MANPYKVGDKVQYLDNDKRVFIVYGIYSQKEVSLSLAGYPGIEQDYTVNINKLSKVN